MRYGVIFDLDGVLVDSYWPHFESWRMVAAEEGIALSEAHFARTFGRTSREIIRMTWTDRRMDEARVRAIDERKESAFRHIIARKFPVMDGAVAVLRGLRTSGFRLAVGSSAPPENVDLALHEVGGREMFDGIVNGMDVERGKPDPQVFLMAAERAGIAPERCAVIEDAAPGVEAAKRAGMASVAFISTGRTEEEFRPVAPDMVIRSLRELNAEVLQRLIDSRSPRPV
jgi:HAD superfamily hydrolase (TIGR01509 family)